jgi:hypothetical protein
VKEETATTITLAQKNPATGKYEYVIDFNTLEEGSDLWLFYQITSFGEKWENLVVTLTPGFDGTAFYTKDATTNTLTIASASSGEVSLRLIADRYDADKWPNLRPDQGEGFEGHIIPQKTSAADSLLYRP